MTIQQLAERYARQFEQADRDNGSTYQRVKADAPDHDTIRDLVFEAHGDMMPDDQRYSMVVACLWDIADMHNPEDGDEQSERLDSMVPIYTSQLTEWLNSRADRYSYCDEACEEHGIESADTIQRLQMGYLCEAQEVFYSVLDSLRTIVDESEASE